MDLTPRPGGRPATSTGIPHTQLDQQPPDRSWSAAALGAAAALPGVVHGPTGISVAGAQALLLPPDAALGPPEAFLVGREFAHLHPGPDASFHLTLPRDLAALAEERGWAEPHILVPSGQVPPTVVMVYAPRTAAERDVVVELLGVSYAFAAGLITAGVGSPSRYTQVRLVRSPGGDLLLVAPLITIMLPLWTVSGPFEPSAPSGTGA